MMAVEGIVIRREDFNWSVNYKAIAGCCVASMPMPYTYSCDDVSRSYSAESSHSRSALIYTDEVPRSCHNFRLAAMYNGIGLTTPRGRYVSATLTCDIE